MHAFCFFCCRNLIQKNEWAYQSSFIKCTVYVKKIKINIDTELLQYRLYLQKDITARNTNRKSTTIIIKKTKQSNFLFCLVFCIWPHVFIHITPDIFSGKGWEDFSCCSFSTQDQPKESSFRTYNHVIGKT